MSLSTIRTQIKTLIQNIITEEIGTVYDYKRFCNDLSTYKELFIKNRKVNTWEIERTSFSSGERGGSGGIEDKTHDFIIRGFYALDDSLASDKVFQDSYVEPVCQQFMNNPTLNGLVEIVNLPLTGNISMQKLGDILCHKVEIKIAITERRFF